MQRGARREKPLARTPLLARIQSSHDAFIQLGTVTPPCVQRSRAEYVTMCQIFKVLKKRTTARSNSGHRVRVIDGMSRPHTWLTLRIDSRMRLAPAIRDK